LVLAPINLFSAARRPGPRNVTARDLRSREPWEYAPNAMSFARSAGIIGLTGLGLCLLLGAPVRASQTSASAIEAPAPAGTGNVSDDCTFNGIKLAGKVKVVDSFPDVRVKAVSSVPDLKVKTVSSFADECGEWQ